MSSSIDSTFASPDFRRSSILPIVLPTRYMVAIIPTPRGMRDPTMASTSQCGTGMREGLRVDESGDGVDLTRYHARGDD